MYPDMSDDPDPYFVTIRESLVGRKAGGSAADKARELRRDHPVASRVARLLGSKTEERAWRKGAHGEQWIGWLLRRLPEGWFHFDDVPIGERGANVDHVVVGPSGLFTINTKNLSGKVWVGPRTLLHDGYRTDYLPKAAAEARAASRRLSSAVGRRIDARAIIAIIADDVVVKQQPPDVRVVRPGGLKGWLVGLPLVLTPADVRDVAAAAAKPETWRSPSPFGTTRSSSAPAGSR
jgi:hypothetical protein